MGAGMRRFSRGEWVAVSVGAAFMVLAFTSVFLGQVGVGVLLGLHTAVLVALAVIHYWTRQHGLVWVHGYHVGFHQGQTEMCAYPDCDVLDFAKERLYRR